MRMAIILAPLLLIGGFVVAGLFQNAGEDDKVHKLELAEACNLATSTCQFDILEFSAVLSAEPVDAGSRLTLMTTESVKAVNLELLSQAGAEPPRAMTPDQADLNKWYLDSPLSPQEMSEVHLVISTGKVFLLGEASW